MIPAFKKQLLGKWDALGAGVPAPKKLSVLGIRGSIRSGRATFLVFAGGREPVFTLKLLRNKAKRDQFENEGTALNALRTAAAVASKIPRVVDSGELAGVGYLLETYLTGGTMNAELGADGLPDDGGSSRIFGLVREWLVELAAATETKPAVDVITPVIKEFRTIFRPADEEEKLLDGIGAQLAGREFPMFRAHGDFCRQNILMAGGRISGVIDWELSRPAEAPLYDLFTFLVNFHLFAGGGGKDFGIECFRRTFFEDNRYSGRVRELVTGCAAALEVSAESLRPLFAYAVAREAVDEFRVLEAAAARGFIPWTGESTDLDPDATYTDLIREQLWRKLFSYFSKNEKSMIF
jgi:hypothetical protein